MTKLLVVLMVLAGGVGTVYVTLRNKVAPDSTRVLRSMRQIDPHIRLGRRMQAGLRATAAIVAVAGLFVGLQLWDRGANVAGHDLDGVAAALIVWLPALAVAMLLSGLSVAIGLVSRLMVIQQAEVA